MSLKGKHEAGRGGGRQEFSVEFWFVHELSIVANIVEAVTESLAAYPGARVREVRLRVGALASVEAESLDFCYGIAIRATALEGSKLVVKLLPVVVHCAACARDVELPGVQSFRCPRCQTQSSDLRQGRELEIDSIEIDQRNGDEEAL
jgi:hydrogenase nickel incorporation protein HypA/HybF